MKILAAVMDLVFVKPFRTVGFGNVVEQFKITKIKKFLVYDPSIVTGWDIQKKMKAWLEE